MARSDADKLMETETTIRWDALTHSAQMWTADIKVRNEWRSNEFPVTEVGRGWFCTVPSNRISYKPLKKTQ